MSLQAESSPPCVRAGGCPALDCRAAATELVKVQLPAAWDVNERYTVLTLVIAACPEHAPELERRSDALLAARADLTTLLTIVDGAVSVAQELCDRADLAEAALRLLEEAGPPALADIVTTARRLAAGAPQQAGGRP